MRRMLIVRHGESEWNRAGRWQGWEDIALTALGEAQARARGAELQAAGLRFTAVHTSDLVRAARTGDLLTEALGGPVARPEPALRERFGGDWEGHTGREIEAKWPGALAAWKRGDLEGPPGGETDAQVLDRVQAALERVDATSPPGPVLVVTHQGVVRRLSTLAGVPPAQPITNLGGRWFEWHRTRLVAGDALAPLAPEPEFTTE